MPGKNSSRFLLLITAVIWGLAFTAQRAGMKHLGPMAFNSLRFALGTLVLTPLFIKRVKKKFIRKGILAGTVLFTGAALQQWGIVYTTASKAGFITGLYILFVPLFGLFTGHKEGRKLWTGIALALPGLWLLSFSEGFERINPGDMLVLAGAFAWAIHVRLIGRYAGEYHPGGFAVVQFSTVALISGAAAILSGESWAGTPRAWLPLAYSGFLSVGIAFTIQIFAQRNVKPASAALIMSLEAAFAALGGWLVLGESMTGCELSGAALMFAGITVSQISSGHKPISIGVN